jgi:hypothetical protein
LAVVNFSLPLEISEFTSQALLLSHTIEEAGIVANSLCFVGFYHLDYKFQTAVEYCHSVLGL